MKLSKVDLTFFKLSGVELTTLLLSDYTICIVRVSNNKIELKLRDGGLAASVTMRNNIERDVFALVCRDM